MGNPVMVEMMAIEKMRELQAEWKRLEPALYQESSPAKQRTRILYEFLSGAWRKAARLIPAWNR